MWLASRPSLSLWVTLSALLYVPSPPHPTPPSSTFLHVLILLYQVAAEYALAHPQSVAGVCNIDQPLHASVEPEALRKFGIVSSEEEFLQLARETFGALYGPLPQEEKERYDALSLFFLAILFHFILFCFILFYFISFYFILFYFILSCSR